MGREFDGRLVFKGESTFDVAKSFGHLAHVNLDIFQMFFRLGRGLAGFLAINHDVGDGRASFFDFAVDVEPVGLE